MQTELKPIQLKIEQGEFQSALADLHVLDLRDQDEIDSLLMQAICHRGLNQRPQALATLKELLQRDDSVVRAYEEIGHLHVMAKNAEQAIQGYAEAVRRDPAAIGAWKQLAMLYKLNRNSPAAEHANRMFDELAQQPKELVAAQSLLNQGRIEQADKICRQFLQANKKHVDGMRLLAKIALGADILDDAEFLLESAVEFEPSHVLAKFELAGVLLKRQKFGRADELASQLCASEPENLDFVSLLGATKLGVGDTNNAIEAYQKLVANKYQLKSTFLMLGHAFKTAGNIESATRAYQNCYQTDPQFGDAYWSLANSKTYRFTDVEIEQMKTQEQHPNISAEDRVHICFALGKAYEDRGEFSESFSYYHRGNQLNSERLNDRSPPLEVRAKWQKANCTKELFEKRAEHGSAANDPIFILGLPRAGSTLLEQILASHSQVDGTLELPNILSLAKRLRGRDPTKAGEEPQYPKILTELDADYFRKFGDQYIEDTRVFRQGAPRFVDKMPNNFLHIGLIKLILPNAKVIDARRHPMACCFSGFKQLFAEGQEFTYGLKEIGSYYRAYVDLMDHWDEVLPGFVLRVQHENVVNDLETEVRRILDFCELDFEPACLDFHKTERNIRTPSSEQVRQPIYKTGLEQWRNYEAHLTPLIDALGDDILRRYPV